MFLLIVISIIIAVGAGCLVKYILDRTENELQISRTELIVGSLIIMIAVAPITAKAGWVLAKQSALSYNEYWNGWEIQAVEEIVKCHKDGSCKYEYQCDPYECNCRNVCTSRDADGNCTDEKRVCDTCWHDCPYFNYERNLYIQTTLGNYPIAWLAPEDYQSQRKTNRLPSRFSFSDYTIPQLWLECKARTEAGNPGPVSKRMQYENYILASDKTILKQYSDQIDQYKTAGLLPELERDITWPYFADKVSYVGFSPSNSISWQESLMYFNAALGTELQGDLHVVITQNELISQDPDSYIIALKAYWQDPKIWGDDAISKNSIIVVVGTTDGKTISWARAKTGMPIGNERMEVEIRNTLTGTLLTPEDLLGTVRGTYITEQNDDGSSELDVTSVSENGALRRIMWGVDNPDTAFTRISMTSNDDEDIGGGFLYLGSEIEPTSGQKVAMYIVIFFISSIVWLVVSITGEPRQRLARWGRNYNPWRRY